MKHVWTDADDKLMLENYHRMGSRMYKILPSKTRDAIWKRAKVLGLSIKNGRGGRRLKAKTIYPENLSSVQLAYIAGLFDGEGNVLFGPHWASKKNGISGMGVRLTITNTNTEALEWIQTILGGGHIASNSVTALAKLPCYHWGTWRVRDCYALAKAILPFTIIKRSQLRELINFCEHEFLIQFE